MADVVITMTVDTDTVNQRNLGTTIVNSITGGSVTPHVPPDSQLDEFTVGSGGSLTFQLQPKNGDPTVICNVVSFATKQNGNSGVNLGVMDSGGPVDRKALSFQSISGADKSSLQYILTLNIKGTTYTFDPKITIHIVHPVK